MSKSTELREIVLKLLDDGEEWRYKEIMIELEKRTDYTLKQVESGFGSMMDQLAKSEKYPIKKVDRGLYKKDSETKDLKGAQVKIKKELKKVYKEIDKNINDLIKNIDMDRNNVEDKIKELHVLKQYKDDIKKVEEKIRIEDGNN